MGNMSSSSDLADIIELTSLSVLNEALILKVVFFHPVTKIL